MSVDEETPKASTRDHSPSSSSSGSDSDASSDNDTKIEWLAMGRAKRSTAGNRMKIVLANEEPDSDLELLFAEDEDDAGFEDAEGGASDVHMDSSSDDEDDQNAADDLDGEKQLEKEARERRIAARKRKAQEAIPAKFRKKVRTQPRGSGPAPPVPAPAPRPRKKSERLSWLPSPLDAPTRASERRTTKMSKEQLHEQMKEREVRRLEQLALMEKRQAQMEARKKPPMTQEQRLAEAASVEKRNAKSLNRWEVAERQREEERIAKLAALHNRTLRGPVITFWSGMGDWGDGRSGQGGAYRISIAEKPKKKRVTAADKAKEKKLRDGSPATPTPEPTVKEVKVEAQPGPASGDSAEERPQKETAGATTTTAAAVDTKDQREQPSAPLLAKPSLATASGLHAPSLCQDLPPRSEARAPLMAPPSMEPKLVPLEGATPKPPLMALPALEASTGPQSVLAAPVLAPPAGLSPTLGNGGFSAPSSPKSHVLAPPNTTQRPSPLSLPPSTAAPAPAQAAAPKPTLPAQILSPSAPKASPPTATTQNPPNSDQPAKSQDASVADSPKPAEGEKPSAEPDATSTRSAILLQNFDDTMLKDKVIQTQILFGRKMSRLQKPLPQPLCAITNQPARYRDPKTGLPYHNAYAYREIQRLAAGEFRWSALLGCWVGKGDSAAKGVPARFLDPEAPAVVRKDEGDGAKGEVGGAQEKSAETTERPGAAQEKGVEARETVEKPGVAKETVEKPADAKETKKPGEGGEAGDKVPTVVPPAAQPPKQVPAESPADPGKQEASGATQNQEAAPGDASLRAGVTAGP